MGSDLHRIRPTDLQAKMLWRRLKGSSPCSSVLTFRLPKQYIGPDTYRFADQNAFERFRTGTALQICQTLVPRRPTSPGGTAPGRRGMPLEGAADYVCGGSGGSSQQKGLAGSREGRTSPGGTAPDRREMPLEGAADSVCGGSGGPSQQKGLAFSQSFLLRYHDSNVD